MSSTTSFIVQKEYEQKSICGTPELSLYEFHVFVIESINRISQWSCLCISLLITDSFNNECEQKSSVKFLFGTLTDFTGYDEERTFFMCFHTFDAYMQYIVDDTLPITSP